ncbi:YojF family protein [Niallia taxi]|uniref:YojF family protein n=1 Tax=Niallia taxi TaxID=2499688 RepID=UPI00119FC9C7|nr:YojF family protein [Niallia taxi]MCT2344292.1 YojF family protein [Niallia taxi]MDE5053732.1 YojF family protein [Niallia taxi]MED3964240.1 YojF family protein [Niallia taxi]WOD63377.1 YojF family protein [Niallia taxi]
MEFVQADKVQEQINDKANKEVYIHLETTNGAYANHNDENFFNSGAYIRNAKLVYEYGKITGEGPYRVGLKTEIGWIYAEGINHYEVDDKGRLLLAGLDFTGKLAVALQISDKPFD